jgi:hypothetical protein
MLHIHFPESLHTLNMGTRSINLCTDNMLKIHRLNLSCNLCDKIKLPIKLHTLIFDWSVQIDNIKFKWPPDLHTLHIKRGYVKNLGLPKTLHVLDLSEYMYCDFNTWLHNCSLHTLILPQGFNRMLPILPTQSLHVIIFGDKFNHDVSNIHIHKCMNIVIFGKSFNRSIRSIKWPNTIEIIKFGKHFNQDVISILRRCNKLMEITFGKSYAQNMTMYNWPNSLIIVNDYSCKITQTSSNFPKSLWKIIHYHRVNLTTYEPSIIYERQIGSHTKAAITF